MTFNLLSCVALIFFSSCLENKANKQQTSNTYNASRELTLSNIPFFKNIIEFRLPYFSLHLFPFKTPYGIPCRRPIYFQDLASYYDSELYKAPPKPTHRVKKYL